MNFNNILPFWVLTVVFFFSSCMTMMHSNHSDPQHNHNDWVDPVCGKPVSENQEFKTTYKGKVYRFESETCLAVFEKNPEHFIKNESHTKSSWKPYLLGGATMVGMMGIMLGLGLLISSQ